jgi:hypothetical protein
MIETDRRELTGDGGHPPHPNPLPRPWGEGRVRGSHVTILMLQVIITVGGYGQWRIKK